MLEDRSEMFREPKFFLGEVIRTPRNVGGVRTGGDALSRHL